jgi:biopolymer transport protein TolR
MAGAMPGRDGGRRKMNADINVVPYIDVMLVLLIIFMVTAPLLTQGVDVELPETEATTMVLNDEPMTLTVKQNGDMTMNFGEKQGVPLTQEEVLSVARTVSSDKEKMVLVEGDAKVQYEYVATAMTLLQQAGIKKIGFVTDPVRTPAPKDAGKRK